MNEKVKKLLSMGHVPLIFILSSLKFYFGVKRVGVHHLQIVFSRMDSMKLQYSIIHSFLNMNIIYISKAGYITKLSRELLEGGKRHAKISTESLQKSSKFFCLAYCSTRYRKSRVGTH